MQSQSYETHNYLGRPPKSIDWKLVDELIEAGSPGSEIAPHFDMHPITFYRAVQSKYGVDFTSYAAGFAQKGCSNIRKKQYDKAIKGDNMMLIWLGKNRLKQSDSPVQDEVLSDSLTKLKELLNFIGGKQETHSPKVSVDDNVVNAQANQVLEIETQSA